MFDFQKGMNFNLDPVIELKCENGFISVKVFEKDVALIVLMALYIFQSKFSGINSLVIDTCSCLLDWKIRLDQPSKHQVRYSIYKRMKY